MLLTPVLLVKRLEVRVSLLSVSGKGAISIQLNGRDRELEGKRRK
jgi:hypothetical protein